VNRFQIGHLLGIKHETVRRFMQFDGVGKTRSSCLPLRRSATRLNGCTAPVVLLQKPTPRLPRTSISRIVCFVFRSATIFTSRNSMRLFLHFGRPDFREAHISEERKQVKLEPSPVTGDIVGVSLSVCERFVFLSELIGRLLERPFVLQRPGAVFSAQGEIPVFGEVFCFGETVCLC
jgi:hypothetical protein